MGAPLYVAIDACFPRPHGPVYISPRAISGDPLVDIGAVFICYAGGKGSRYELGAQAIGVFYCSDALVGREVLFGRVFQAVCARGLSHYFYGEAVWMKGGNGL